ncbi:galactose-binding domain-like protein [Mycena sanguinolenta]|nr:galactose-binding domain-like protein [Mycena sanguinolenta]
MAAKSTSRGWVNGLVDRFTGWRAGLPPSCSYTVHPVKIPLAGNDNIQLVADLYQPTHGKPPAGTVLMQSPYGRGVPISITARTWAGQGYNEGRAFTVDSGYNVLLVSTRGTFGSGGTLDPARTDAVDGPPVVAWMRAQAWYTGTFATLGASFLGYTQWALLSAEEPPEDMVAAIITVAPQDFSDIIWGTGALWLPTVDWARNTSMQETMSAARILWILLTAGADGWISVKKSLPLLDGAKAALGDQTPWLYEWMTRPDIANDPFWKPASHIRASETAKVPILLFSGWHDVATLHTLAAYQRLRDRGCTVALTVGPGNHLQSQSGENYLAKRTTGDPRPSPVRINVTGANEWRWLPSWPPSTKPMELFLDPKGALSRTQVSATDKAKFTFDPRSPTPTMGGPLLFGGGSVNDSALAKRTDILSFTSAPLTEDVKVLGRPSISLLHSTDNPHVDLFVRLSEVGANGVSHNITEVYKRLDPARPRTLGEGMRVQLELSDCAHRFKRGTRIRVLVAGGCFPLYSFNLGSGEPQATGTTLRPADHGVHCGGKAGSKLVLPVA